MATAVRLRPSLVPQCPACARRFLDLGSNGGLRPRIQTHIQTRGKKKSTKDKTNTITVKLLKDVTAFGRQGAFVPISSGQMRNDWFPSGTADYVPKTQLRQLTLDNVSFARDHAFVTADDSAQQILPTPSNELPQPEREAAPAPIKITQLSPKRVRELLEIFVPQRIDFYRQAIEAESTSQSTQQQQAVSSAAAIMAAAAAKARPKAPVSIYGSVSVSDVAASIAAALRENDEAARVVVSESDVQFVELADREDKTRLKHIGEFAIEIQPRGTMEPVRRVVRVLPSEGQDEET